MAIGFGVPCPKPVKGTKKREKNKKTRADSAEAQRVRALCVARDGYCAFTTTRYRGMPPTNCAGASEWAHLKDRRRSKTRGLAPELRHSVQHSFMGCTQHHQLYDQHRVEIQPLAEALGMEGDFLVTWTTKTLGE